jgi:class 3 adenylate cyclase/tetratricopeptide (TPR) repeat protein
MPAVPAVGDAGERKFAVMVFADLTGYTDLCRRLDPEDVAATVRPVMLAMRAAVEREGGSVPSIAGDGFMAVFGVPTALSDAAARAVRAAQDMLRIIEESNAAPRAFRIPDVHIGIAAGEVLVLPSDETVGWSLVGSPVNLASRLCDAAGPGQVLVDDEVRRLATGAAAWSSAGPVDVRGAHEAVSTWTLLAGASETSPAAGGVAFVDRVQTLHQLDGELESAAALGVSRALTVSGETGIGKSRMVRHWLADRSIEHVWVWCGETATASQLGLLVDRLGELRPEETADARQLWGAATTPVTSALRADPFPAALAAARQVVEAAATGPMVIALDDAHLADTSVVELVRDLRTQPLRAPVVVLCTWRTDESEVPWPVDVELGPLPDDACAELVTRALGAAAPEEVAGAIVARAAGHPLMTLQSAAYLVETGAVEVEDGVCEVRSPEAMSVLPTSLRLFVAARIDRLPTTEKSALQELSTFGERIGRNAVDRLAARHIVDAIPALVRRGLLRPTDDGWRFAHGLMQQVAYTTLPRSVRAELHRRQLQVLDRERTGARVYHAVRWADCVSSADPQSRHAAVAAALDAVQDHATQLSATQAAAAHAAVRDVAGLLADHELVLPAKSAALLTLDSQCLLEMGRFEAALHEADRALAVLSGQSVDERVRVLALMARGHALSRLRRFQAARQSLDEAMNLAESSGEDVLRARALRLIGDTWRYSDFGRFVALTEQAYELFAGAGDRADSDECARILAYLMSTSTSPRYRRWREAAQAGLPEQDLRGRAWLARTDVWAMIARREYAGARDVSTEAVRLGELTGAADCVADGLSGLTQASTALGDLDTAVDAFERFRQFAVTNANPRMRLYAASMGAVALLRRGLRAEAVDEITSAATQVDGFGLSERYTLSMAAARLAADRGRWDEAAQHAAAAVDAGAAATFTLPALEARLLQARVYLQLGQPPSADYLVSLEEECVAADAPALAAYAAAVRAQSTRNAGDLPGADVAVAAEDAAIHAESRALVAEATGDAVEAWRAAATAWAACGSTVWLARAQLRCGDVAAAEETLASVGADEAARVWASGEPAA